MFNNTDLKLNTILLSFTILSMPAISWAAEVIPVTAAQQKALHIQLASLQPAVSLNSQRLPGEIVVPVSQSRIISAPQPGLIDTVTVATGQTVRKGQVLAHISSPELVALQRDHLQALSQQRLSQNSLNRDAELYKDGIIAERRFLTTQSNHSEVNAQLAERRQALRLSGMSDQAIRQLESSGSYASGMNLVAPLDGVVLEQLATAGQRIDVSTPIYRIARLNPLWLEIHAPVQALAGLSNGLPVNIVNTKASGKIIAIVRNINKLDQTALVRVEISNGTESLSPGQLVEAEIQHATGQLTFAIPRSAVIQKGTGADANESYIFVKSASGITPQRVEVVSTEGSKAIIRAVSDKSPLTGKEQVVISGTAALKAKWLGIGENHAE